jgi:hypothetical protein
VILLNLGSSVDLVSVFLRPKFMPLRPRGC